MHPQSKLGIAVGSGPESTCVSDSMQPAIDVSRVLQSVGSIRLFSRRTFPFLEGAPSRNLYVVCDGRVKLCVSSCQGRSLGIRVAGPQQILGLAAIVSGQAYEATAETIVACRLAIVSREDFLQLMDKRPDLWPQLTLSVADSYYSACGTIRDQCLTKTVLQRVVRLLLEASEQADESAHTACFRLSLTHFEIAEMVATSRETVSRALSFLRGRRLLTMTGRHVSILNRAALVALLEIVPPTPNEIMDRPLHGTLCPTPDSRYQTPK